ncbi:MAG: Lipopolysaccharide assembly protein B [Desulfovibrio sp.]
MALFGKLRRTVKSLLGKGGSPALPGEGERPSYRDTLAAIHDLSRLVRNDPEAVDIYLALGNLFRAQGDIERAVMIREGLIARHGLNTQFKARSYFELGQDYHRAGVIDRSLAAFREAARLGYSEDAVTVELADLFASAGDFEKAAAEYGELGHHLAEAHYIVRRAEELASTGDEAKSEKLVKKALRTYPGSVEAWSAITCMAALSRDWRKMAAHLERALGRIEPRLQFLVLDALLEAQEKITSGTDVSTEEKLTFAKDMAEATIPVIEKQTPQILLHYYGALLLKYARDFDGVDVWLAKALVVQPDFWAARLEALSLSVERHELPPVVSLQVGYLAEELQYIKRFVCSVCGFRENQVFYRCRRCGSWHSLSFRLSLQE